MDYFFTSHPEFSDIKEKLLENQVVEDQFYTLKGEQIFAWTGNLNKSFNFVAALAAAKVSIKTDFTIDLEAPTPFNPSPNTNESNSLQKNQNPISEPTNDPEHNPNASVASEVVNTSNESFTINTYVQNDLYNFLNSSLDGELILGIYKETQKVDYLRFKELVIMNEVSKDRDNYHITTERFQTLREQTLQLFPTEDPDNLYQESYTNSNGIGVGPGGSLYLHWLAIRQRLVIGGLFKFNNPTKNTKEVFPDKDSILAELSEKIKSQVAGDIAGILNLWTELYDQRFNFLKPKAKNRKIVFPDLNLYFERFDFLKPPIGIVLLQADFDTFMKNLIKGNYSYEVLLSNYANKFIEEWQNYVNAIINVCKKSKNKEIKKFLSDNKKIFDADCLSLEKQVATLILVAFYIPLARSFNNGETTYNLTKNDILKTFIYMIEDHQDLDDRLEDQKLWLLKYNQYQYPYVIIRGNFENIIECYVIINNHKYLCENPLQAVQNCFKVLIALNSFPYSCEHIWNFIEKLVYKIAPTKIYTKVNNFIKDINLYKNSNSANNSSLEISIELET